MRFAASIAGNVLLAVMLSGGLGLVGVLFASNASCAHPEPAVPPANPADNVECYWSTHHGLCLCSGNWHDQNPHLVLTGAKTAKACL